MKTYEKTAVKLLSTISSWLKRRIPALDWLAHYERKHLPGDALAGVIVATLLIPQAMAYALLAGLPPQVGLYASLLPLADTELLEQLGSERIFFTTVEAYEKLDGRT